MKKLSLNSLNLSINDFLNRDQLKSIFGGYNGTCTANCSTSCSVTCSGGSCSAVDGSSGYCTENGQIAKLCSHEC